MCDLVLNFTGQAVEVYSGFSLAPEPLAQPVRCRVIYELSNANGRDRLGNTFGVLRSNVQFIGLPEPQAGVTLLVTRKVWLQNQHFGGSRKDLAYSSGSSGFLHATQDRSDWNTNNYLYEYHRDQETGQLIDDREVHRDEEELDALETQSSAVVYWNSAV